MEPEGSLPHSQVSVTCPYPAVQVRDFLYEYFVTVYVLGWGVVSTSPNPQAGGPPLVGCPQLLIQYMRSYPPCCRPFLHPQHEDAPFHGDRGPLITAPS